MFTVRDVINTLNSVEVKGKDNLDKLLGAIMALEFMEKAQQNTETENTDETPEEV